MNNETTVTVDVKINPDSVIEAACIGIISRVQDKLPTVARAARQGDYNSLVNMAEQVIDLLVDSGAMERPLLSIPKVLMVLYPQLVLPTDPLGDDMRQEIKESITNAIQLGAEIATAIHMREKVSQAYRQDLAQSSFAQSTAALAHQQAMPFNR